MPKPIKSKKEKLNPRAIQQSYLERMESELEKQGAVFFDADTNLDINSEYLSLPAEITEVPSRELGEYLNAFTQQKVYLRTLLGRTELLVEEAQRVYLDASAELYRKYSLEKMSETAKDRLINSHASVKPSYEALQDCRKKRTLVEYSIANIEDILFMLSREVTRRNGDFSEENRAHNVTRR